MHDAVGEQNEPGPRDRCVPRGEWLHTGERRGLGHDHDRETGGGADVHVILTRYDSPHSGAVPTPLPSRSTFIVLPRPPGHRSVFSASRVLRSAASTSCRAPVMIPI